jgi:hypothetical protein
MASNKIYGLPNKRKVATPPGRAADLNLAARVHAQAAYSPKPFPKQS